MRQSGALSISCVWFECLQQFNWIPAHKTIAHLIHIGYKVSNNTLISTSESAIFVQLINVDRFDSGWKYRIYMLCMLYLLQAFQCGSRFAHNLNGAYAYMLVEMRCSSRLYWVCCHVGETISVGLVFCCYCIYIRIYSLLTKESVHIRSEWGNIMLIFLLAPHNSIQSDCNVILALWTILSLEW